MITEALPYIERNIAKGRLYLRYRRNGYRIPLPSDDKSKEFHACYKKVHDSFERQGSGSPSLPGSVHELVDIFQRSRAFADLRPGVQKAYRFYLGLIAREFGDVPAVNLKRADLLDWRSRQRAKPARANGFVAAVSRLFNFAIGECLVLSNPADQIKKLPIGEWRAWTENEIMTFERSATPTIQLLLQLILCTGLGVKDLARLTLSNISADYIEITTGSSAAVIQLRLTENLKVLIKSRFGSAHNDTHLLSSAKGKALSADELNVQFGNGVMKAGLPSGCVPQGLRKNAASSLSKLGHRPDLVRELTGRKVIAFQGRATHQASPHLLARLAMERFENALRTHALKSGYTQPPRGAGTEPINQTQSEPTA